MDNDLTYKHIQPERSLADFVESFWLLHNHSDCDKKVVVLPDGRIALFFTQAATQPFRIILLGIGTRPGQAAITPERLTFAVSFKPLAMEYIVQKTFPIC